MSIETKIVKVVERPAVNLREYMRNAAHPLLCVGPMSKNCVDAIIQFANDTQRPFPLIASRRQIECEEFGGGYVNGWNTATFASYVMQRDKGFVPLCRDHGGPWQGNGEADLPDHEAMQKAKVSMLEDITHGFDVIHIDPSLKGGSILDPSTLEKIFDLYAFVCETARRLGRRIEIEVGAEQQSGRFSDAQELVSLLKAITAFCERRNFQRPLFCVAQTGTLVREMRNVGFTEGRKNEAYDQKYAVESIEKTVKYLSDIAYINGVYIKEHNGDYLSDGSMSLRHKLDVGAVNVAPEFGVFESKCYITLCQQYGLNSLLEKMLTVFYNSHKWEKWLSVDSQANDLDKAIMAGHYTFGSVEFQELRNELARAMTSRGMDLDKYIVTNMVGLLTRMVWNLGYFDSCKGFRVLRSFDDVHETPSLTAPSSARSS